eukprot:TRINITY_DN164_c0_g1_i1.p2 TRINITY_DN164_c0_g1~~TRINITY_DN164_c0_g1_i1.p2  ORF type:complete len:114 (+),score=6.25 TRINITY_DN164_c0_g1_i1:284-625(+)
MGWSQRLEYVSGCSELGGVECGQGGNRADEGYDASLRVGSACYFEQQHSNNYPNYSSELSSDIEDNLLSQVDFCASRALLPAKAVGSTWSNLHTSPLRRTSLVKRCCSWVCAK